MEFFIRNSNNCHIGFDENVAEEIFERFPAWKYLIQDIKEMSGTFLYKDGRGIGKVNDIYEVLKNKGVHVYRISIPSVEDIDNTECYGVGKKHNRVYAIANLIADGGMQPPEYIDKITDMEIGRYTKRAYTLGKTYGNGNRKIYIVGPCIVAGWENLEKESLVEILSEKMMEFGLKYTVLPIQQTIGNDREKPSILEYNIRENDIVIFVNTKIENAEFDTTSLFNSYKGEKWLFQGQRPIHTTVTGNRLLAEYLIENIIKPLSIQSSRLDDDVIIYEGEPQFTYDMQEEIEKYISRIKGTRAVNPNADVGAIVMNCNPFTRGHRCLVEYASKQADFLYLFVVEEDLSAVPFTDRLFMVYEGVKDIDNVIVVPSGHFIISQDTFKNYFKKETDIHNVSAEEDVYIFARYIAKGLNITKRFVGEEPVDYVTNVYNQTMKKVFVKYGIDLIEIPRKELDNGKIISATEVRKLLLNDELAEIAKYVPQSTFDYLIKIKDTVKHRIENIIQSYIQTQIEEFVDKVCSLGRAVVYTVGHDTRGLLEHLPAEVIERLEYCDKSARTERYSFNGKIVEPPEQLLHKFKDYKIIVTSTGYGAEIYEEFLEMGIEMDRCIFNSIIFDANY